MHPENDSHLFAYLETNDNIKPTSSSGNVMDRIVDDLFTCQEIIDKLEGLEHNEKVQKFIAVWKQNCTLRLRDRAEKTVDGFIADLERFLALQTE